MTALESSLTVPALAVFGPVIGLSVGLAGLVVVWCLVAIARWVIGTPLATGPAAPTQLRLVAAQPGPTPPGRLHQASRVARLLALHALLSSRAPHRGQDERRRAA